MLVALETADNVLQTRPNYSTFYLLAYRGLLPFVDVVAQVEGIYEVLLHLLPVRYVLIRPVGLCACSGAFVTADLGDCLLQGPRLKEKLLQLGVSTFGNKPYQQRDLRAVSWHSIDFVHDLSIEFAIGSIQQPERPLGNFPEVPLPLVRAKQNGQHLTGGNPIDDG